MTSSYRNLFRVLFLLTPFALSTGCDRVIDQVEPLGVTDIELQFNDPVGIANATNSVYASMRGAYLGLRLQGLAGLLADEMDIVNIGSSGRGFDEVRNVGTEGTHLAPWGLYSTINQINLILDNVNTVPNLSASEKARITAENLAMRAFYHFEIARAYSHMPGAIQNGWDVGIPYLDVSNDDVGTAVFPPRGTVAQTYQRIIQDLEDALDQFALLTTPNARGRFFMTRAGARALLARAYLYNQQWADAAAMADLAIADAAGVGASLATAGTFPGIWTTPGNPEAIFEVSYQNTGENRGAESVQGLLLETNGGWGDYVLSDTLFKAYARFYDGTQAYGDTATTDVRGVCAGGLLPGDPILDGVDVNFDATPTGQLAPLANSETEARVAQQVIIRYARPRGGNWYTINKWRRQTGRTNYGWHNVPLIRYAEVLLIRAEARARSGNEAGALTDLNLLRTNRSAANYGALTGQNLLDAILYERWLELCGEGHRWFDLRRYGRDITKAAGYPTLLITAREILAPVPNNEVLLTGVTQNPGY